VAIDYRVASEVAAPIQAVAYYVISEALANSAKHAEATRSRIDICSGNGALVVTVADDGRGGADPAGSGLTGLADRVAAVNGTLIVHSTPPTGTRITAELPCE
jgi:signal transduction histidine kinase